MKLLDERVAVEKARVLLLATELGRIKMAQ
jgi:hypothetical protein